MGIGEKIVPRFKSHISRQECKIATCCSERIRQRMRHSLMLRIIAVAVITDPLIDPSIAILLSMLSDTAELRSDGEALRCVNDNGSRGYGATS